MTIFLKVHLKFKVPCIQDNWIFLEVGKYQIRAPTAYLSIYIDEAPAIFGKMELLLYNKLKEK